MSSSTKERNKTMSGSVQPATKVGVWHLEIVRKGWANEKELMNPPPGFQMNDTTADHPQTYGGTIGVGSEFKISFDNPNSSFICTGGPENNPCAFVDFVLLTQLDDQHIRYDAKNHGGRVFITFKINQQKQEKVVEKTDNAYWVEGKIFL